MAALIKLKKSSTAAAVPTAGALDYGELAINYTDGILYYKDNGNVIKQLASNATVAGAVLLTGTQTITGAKTFNSTLTLAPAASLTASQPAIDITQTWNASGVTFTGLKQNITNNGSAVGSLLMDLQVGGSSKFRVDSAGSLKLNGTQNTFGTAIIDFSNSSGFATASQVSGISGETTNSGAGSIIGINVNAATSFAGTVASLTSVMGNVRTLNASTVVTNSRMFYALSPIVTAGAITNQYGLYIESQKPAGVTAGYGVYQLGATDINYFAGNVGIGTTAPTGKIDIQGSSVHDLPTYSAEFLLGTTWVSTGWTGSFADGWTHTTGNTSVLSHDKVAVITTKYQIAYTVTTRTAGSFTIAFGGESIAGVSATGAWGPTTSSTAPLTITPTTDFDGTIAISIKSITSVSTALVILKSSDGTARIEIRGNKSDGNTFIGLGAGRYTTTGYSNTANGYQSLINNTTGYQNTANGYASLYYNTTGYLNTANGAYSLYTNTTGYQNTANGYGSLYNNTTGFGNQAVGVNALQSNTTGYYNIAIGTVALQANTTGINNLACGHASLNVNATGSNNTAYGYASLLSATNSSSNNTVVGANAGRTLTTSNNNTFLGNSAGYHASQSLTASNSMALGNGTYTTADNQVVIGNTSVTQTQLNGSVGIGTTTPGDVLHISANGGVGFRLLDATVTTGGDTRITQLGQKLSINTYSNGHVFTGTPFVIDGTTQNVGIGTAAPNKLLTLVRADTGTSIGSGKLLRVLSANAVNAHSTIGFGWNSHATNADPVIIGYKITSTTGFGQGNFYIANRNGTTDVEPTEVFTILPDGNVGIGTTSPVALLTVGSTTTTTSAMTLQGEYQSSVFNSTNTFNFRHGGSDRWRLATNQNSGASNDFDFKINSLNAAATSHTTFVTIKGLTGNVGIGTISPTNILSLGNAAAQKFWIENSATDVVGRALTVAAGGTVTGTSTSDVVGGNLILQSGLGTGTGASTISFQTGTTLTTGLTLQTMSTKMTILGSGNVGIGTTAPLLKLDVAGSGRFTGASTSVLTGTIDAIASTTVTGVGTLFLTELVVGDRITITGETRTVTAIASNLSLTVDAATTDTANDTSVDKLAAIFVTRLSSNTIGMVQNDLGNLGIGLAAPADKLHINAGDLRIGQSNSSTDTITNNINFVNTNVTNSPIAVISVRTGAAATSNSNLIFQTAVSGTPSEKMRIAGDGNVGIGTTSPAYPLHVVGAGSNIIRYDRTSVGSFNAILSGQLTGSAVDFLMSANQASSGFLWQPKNASNVSINALSIDRNGNVGIGTTAPAYTLDVTGTGRFTSTLLVSGATTIASSLTVTGTPANLGRYTTFSAGGVQTNSFNDNSAAVFPFVARNTQAGANYGTGYGFTLGYGGGQLLDGTSVAAGDIAVAQETTYTSTLSTQDSYMRFSTSLDGVVAEKMRITSTGNVSIAGALTTTVGGAAGTGTQTMATRAYLGSRGMNLVVNGTAFLGNNYNFSGFTFDQTDTFTGKGSFRALHGTVGSGVVSDESISVDPDKTHLLTIYAKTTQFTSLSVLYAGIDSYDIDGIQIGALNVMRQTGTDTRLLVPLATNDMVVVVTTAPTSWYQAAWVSTEGYKRAIILWGYKNSFGYTYPDYTYSRYWLTDMYLSTNSVSQLVLTNFGSGYTDGTYSLTFTPVSGGTGAAGSYVVLGGGVVSVYITADGSGYIAAPTVSFPSGGGINAAATAKITSNATTSTVQYLVKGVSGAGYTGTTQPLTFTGGGATTQATGHVTINSGGVDRVVLLTTGSGYTSNPTVTVGGTPTTVATVYATIGTGIDQTNNRIYLRNPFPAASGYLTSGTTWPIGSALSNGSSGGTYKYIAVNGLTIPTSWTKYTGKIGGIDPNGQNALNDGFRPGTAAVKILFLPNQTSIANCVISTTVSTAGSGYTSIPTLTFGSTPTAGSLTATGSAVMRVVSVTGFAAAGSGYAVGNIITVLTGTGTAATFQVTVVTSGAVTTLVALNTGGAYTVLPTLTAVATTANPAGGTGLTLNLSMGIGSVTILTTGSGYSAGAPALTSAASAGVTATLACTIGNNAQNYSDISFTEVADRNVATFQPLLTTEVGLNVKLLTSQTAAMQEWQNSSGTALASIGTSGQFLAGGVGSAAFPGIAFQDDTNTGMWRSAADTLQLVTNGVARVTIDSAGNLNGPAGAHFNISPASTYSIVLGGNVSTAGSTTTTIGGAIIVNGAATLSSSLTVNNSTAAAAVNVFGNTTNMGYTVCGVNLRNGSAPSTTKIDFYLALQNNTGTGGESNGIILSDNNGTNARTYIDIRYNNNAPTIRFGDSTTTAYGGTLLAATFSGTLTVAGTITGSSTIQGTRLISTVAIGTAPLTVTSTTAVTNLNADLLDGQDGTYYQSATNLNAGTVATARLGSGTANATAVLRGDQTWGAPIGIVPVGAVLSWLKSFTNTPALATEFVECNGQTLSDTDSPFNGQVIPNLNGATVNSVVGTRRFLRGYTASGATGGSETHTHTVTTSSVCVYTTSPNGTASFVTSPTGSTSGNTLPSYYEVVWIIRIK